LHIYLCNLAYNHNIHIADIYSRITLRRTTSNEGIISEEREEENGNTSSGSFTADRETDANEREDYSAPD